MENSNRFKNPSLPVDKNIFVGFNYLHYSSQHFVHIVIANIEVRAGPETGIRASDSRMVGRRAISKGLQHWQSNKQQITKLQERECPADATR